MPALLSTKEAAAHLFGEATRKTEQIVRRMIADRELAARRIGRKFYIPAAEIERLGRPDEL
jgi:excisionase family DNA binding protein